MQRKFDAAVLQAQQRSALRAAVLERRLEAAMAELAHTQQADSTAAGGSGRGLVGGTAAAGGRSRAVSAAVGAAGGAGSGSRRGSKEAGADGGSGSSDWVRAMLEAALHTPLPDQDADIFEDDAPGEVLEQIAELAEAADVAETVTGAVPGRQGTGSGHSSSRGGAGAGAGGPSPLDALEEKLSQAAQGAAKAAASAAAGQGLAGAVGAGLLIPAHRDSQQQ